MRGVPVLGFILLLGACRRSDGNAAGRIAGEMDCAPVVPAPLYGYSDADARIPPHFLSSVAGRVNFADNTPPHSHTTNAGATLGRILFYDKRLSATDRVACASCHQQKFGFGDTARFSAGLNGRHVGRHAMALANARFYRYGRLAWDQRGGSLEAQVLRPISDVEEMGMTLDSLERKLRSTPFYPALFAAAFGSRDVSRDRIAAALSQFVRSLVSAQSRFDAVFATGGAPNFTSLTKKEIEGFQLFSSSGCAGCHRTIAHVADTANNIGLDVASTDSGAGRGRFKPPSLRNVAVRAPYMHDGRFKSLREVLEFYSTGVRANPFLDQRLRAADGSPRRLNLTNAQLDALEAFLEALTDTVFLRAPKFADPFPCHPRD